MTPARFEGMRTSRTIKSTQLRQDEIDEAVRMGKFEECPLRHQEGKLPYGWHGVNVFTVPELKGRRRLITEPLVNACINRKTLPALSYPRGSAGDRHYAMRTTCCRSISKPSMTPFRCPRTLETTLSSGRASGTIDFGLCRPVDVGVAVGQAVTWTIVDIDTPCTIYTMIDNILIAGQDGQEREFVDAVRSIVNRIKSANLLTSPDRDTLARATDEEILRLGNEPNTFLGEEYVWSGEEMDPQLSEDGGKAQPCSRGPSVHVPLFCVADLADPVRVAHNPPQPGGGIQAAQGVPRCIPHH
eukprot:gene3683-biopygen2215